MLEINSNLANNSQLWPNVCKKNGFKGFDNIICVKIWLLKYSKKDWSRVFKTQEWVFIDGYKTENYGASYIQNTIFTLKYFVFNYTIGKIRMCARSVLGLKPINYLRFNYGIGS